MSDWLKDALPQRDGDFVLNSDATSIVHGSSSDTSNKFDAAHDSAKEVKDEKLGTPPAMRRSDWRSVIALFWDKVYFEVCVLAVRLAIILQSIPVLNELSRRVTMMSGNLDTNANLCLFLRQLYSRAPAPLTYDPQEIYFASMFLEAQYRLLSWIVTYGSWRLLPPLLRPLFKAYYGRARRAREFVIKCIEEYEVEQIVILGAGFDSNAYRSRELRIQRDGKDTRRFVRVFEVDRPEVNALKLAGLKRGMSQAEFRYYAEGVTYVVCNFGVDSVRGRLLEHGLDPQLSTAVLWEGVTYYLDRTALNATLQELRNLFTCAKDEERRHVTGETQAETPRPGTGDLHPSGASTAATSHDLCSRESSSSTPDDTHDTQHTPATHDTPARNGVYLFMDYMLVSATLSEQRMREDRVWRLNMLLAEALGTRFITGFSDASAELEPFGWKCIHHTTYEDVEKAYFSNLPQELQVFEERNTTYGHNEPRLNCVECVFVERCPSHTTWS
eukprot:Gregarina_sp_Pseudo_9__5182@NODE_55_length_4759_cov_242_162500_g52_i0_p1_GENE_NODE_55_length_4759_cov_242_162500_g52_i0NODE_55_length_4759_cov_242_162500_g52_i0_p1_ORF_typecomplete_len500_score144_14LCM/PF04072_14/1_3e22_NODE_55_length_4759_cov_242_162500_g52_i0821581